MLFFLLFELILVTLLAGVFGYLIAGKKGVLSLMSQVLVLNGLMLLIVWSARQTGWLPINHLDWRYWRWEDNYLSASALLLEITILTTPWSGAVWYLLDNEGEGAHNNWVWNAVLNVFLVGIAMASVTIMVYLFNMGVAVNLLLSGLTLYLLGLLFLGVISFVWHSTRGWKLLLIWSVFSLLLFLGYRVAGRLSLYFIFFPTLISVFATIFFLSSQVLPIDNSTQLIEVFKGLLGFIVGRHYPYYFIGDWQRGADAENNVPDPTVPGNPFSRSFTGPGIVLNDSNHLALMWNGYTPRICPPGLDFSYKYEELFAAVDLRPQLRVTKVDAETSDGIVTNTLLFMPHRIATNGAEVRLGHPYPYDADAVIKAVYDNDYVEHTWSRDEKGLAHEDVNRIPWHELVVMQGPEILKQIIAEYKCNELHTDEKEPDPRVAIASEFVDELRTEMTPLGIELVGGGISNITISEKVEKQRIENWKAKWKARIELEVGWEEAAATLSMENIWAEAQLNVLEELVEIIADSSTTKEMTAFHLLSALYESPPTIKNVQENIPTFAWSLFGIGAGNE